MPDYNRDDTRNAFKEECDLGARPGEKAMVDTSMAILESSSSSSAPRYRIRTPDFSVGPELSEEERKRLPSAYRGITWTPRNRARLTVEITSFNASTDIDEKAQDYAKEKVSRYMIVHRNKKNAGTNKHKRAVHYGRLEGDSYNFASYEKGSNEKVGSLGPLHHTADILLDPRKLRAITERKREQGELERQRKEAKERERRENEERKKAEDWERREKAERRKAEERERREKEERKKAEERERLEKKDRKKAEERERREKEERKKAEERTRAERHKRKSLKDRLRKLGEPVSDSSSECSSPPRKRR